MINMLLFLIVGVFLAGQMVGRTPEYLGKKIGAREMKLAMIALLVHPIMILVPTGLFAATDWGTESRRAIPAPHGFSQIVYQFSSASANNGSAFDGLGVTYGFANNTSPGADGSGLGHRGGIGDDHQPLSADHRPDRDGGLSRREEARAVRAGDIARRHDDLRLPAVWHDTHHRGAAVPARRRARARSPNTWARSRSAGEWDDSTAHERNDAHE